jgi:deazaflavin-dependent oxidoreductase (nitroreductase family)
MARDCANIFSMKDSHGFPLVFWRVISRLNRRLVSGYGPKSKASKRVLVLTTIGRKSGQPRSTPLQFEEVDGIFYVASARGSKADWYRNLIVNPQVEVRVKDKNFQTRAELIAEPGKIADFLELRLKRHPHFMGVLLCMEGLPSKFSRTDLVEFAERLAIVALPQDCI